MRFRYFLGVKGISYDGWRRESLYYAGFFSKYHDNEEWISCQECLCKLSNKGIVSYVARIGNGRHLFAVATKRVSKNFIS